MAEAEAIGLDATRRRWAERVFHKYSNASTGLLRVSDFHTICMCGDPSFQPLDQMQKHFANAGAESGLADLKSFVLFVWIMFGSLPEESFLFLMGELLAACDFSELLEENQELQLTLEGGGAGVPARRPSSGSSQEQHLLEVEDLLAAENRRCAALEEQLALVQQQVLEERGRRHSMEVAIEQGGVWDKSPVLKRLASFDLGQSPRSTTHSGRRVAVNVLAESPDGTDILAPIDTPPMFHAFFIASLQAADGSAQVVEEDPSVIYRFPNDVSLPDQVEHFCFPAGSQVRTMRRSDSDSDLQQLRFGQGQMQIKNSFSLLFSEGTEDTSGTLYGVCVINEELLSETPAFDPLNKNASIVSPTNSALSSPKGNNNQKQPLKAVKRCYCLLSHHPFFEMHFEVLYGILAQQRLQHMLTTADADDQGVDLRAVLQAFYSLQVPAVGQPVSLQCAHLGSIHFQCPIGDFKTKLLAYHGCITTFQMLSLETFVQVLSVMLTECSLVVMSSELGAVSSFVMSLKSMLCPLAWQGMFVPVLPERLHCFLDAPVPLIVGVHGMPSVALNSHHVYLSLDSDMLQTSTDILPLVNQEKLIARLRPFHQKLQKCAPEYGSPKHKRFTQGEQQAIVDGILTVLKLYFISLLDMLQAKAIVGDYGDDDVQSNKVLRSHVSDRLAPQDRRFMNAFLDTQMFAALCQEQFQPEWSQ